MAVWVTYLGLLLCLTGITGCVESSLAGSWPTEEEKRFSSNVAYVGAGIATPASVVGYVLGVRGRMIKRIAEKIPLPTDS